MSAAQVEGQARLRYSPCSLYVNGTFYEWLLTVSADLSSNIGYANASAAPIRDAAAALILREARLLDQGGFEPWLELFVDECAYWIPAGSPAPDPRSNITLEFHDRRRLLDRIARLRTGLAFSQVPASRTTRVTGGLELWPAPGRTGDWHARCSFLLAETREGKNRQLAGWNGFVLREVSDGLRIVLKQVNLIDSESPQGNNSFFL